MRENEEKRINKEMANIRKKFKGAYRQYHEVYDACNIGSIFLEGNLDGYQKKK